jgi:hypothetical protein
MAKRNQDTRERVDPAKRSEGTRERVDPAKRSEGTRERVDPAKRSEGTRERVDPAKRSEGTRNTDLFIIVPPVSLSPSHPGAGDISPPGGNWALRSITERVHSSGIIRP